MPALDSAEANRLINASFLGVAYTTATSPLKLRLMTTATVPSATVAGTEVSGGSYPAGGISLGTGGATIFPTTGTAGSVTNSNGAISYTNMPATTVAAVEVFDAVPTRKWWATITNKTTVLGDTITFATNSITASVA